MAVRTSTVVGVFADLPRAEGAIQALHDAGLRRDQINLILRDRSRRRSRANATETAVEEGALTGAVAGGIAGSVLGITLATIALPGIGTLLATSVAAGLLGGAATGAAAGGLIGALAGLGLTEDQARHFAKEVRAGRIVILVRSTRVEDVCSHLRRFGAELHPAAPGLSAGH